MYADACEHAYERIKNVIGYCTKRKSLVDLPGMIETAPGLWPSPCPLGASLIGSGVSADFSISRYTRRHLLGKGSLRRQISNRLVVVRSRQAGHNYAGK